MAYAEDVVPETYARWYAMSAQQREAISSVGAWLTKVANRNDVRPPRFAMAGGRTFVRSAVSASA
ncbi:hypothetical protein ABN034_11710 [Actinopolymorpha sp. B11F2]|uniref:hypothetical protein n=1 Tax=Actinopolymorpha sp. B11F2 TaxID=3160862 RepID=UPI0032E4F8BB